MTDEAIKKALELHKMWLHNEEDGVPINLLCEDLSGYNFSGCDLSGIKFNCCNLSGCDFSNCDLRYSDLSQCDLVGCDFSGCNMEFTNLTYAKLDEKERFRLGTILKEPLTAWKNCRFGTIVKLEVPKGAVVFSINGSKCRTNKARVVEIIGAEVARSRYDCHFVYHLGDEIEIENFNLQYNVECGTGIHFFRTREEAEKY